MCTKGYDFAERFLEPRKDNNFFFDKEDLFDIYSNEEQKKIISNYNEFFGGIKFEEGFENYLQAFDFSGDDRIYYNEESIKGFYAWILNDFKLPSNLKNKRTLKTLDKLQRQDIGNIDLTKIEFKCIIDSIVII